MNIKETIADIAERYGLKVEGESFEAKIKRTIVQILNQIPRNKKIAIRGAGTHTKQLLSLEGLDTTIFECIFDYATQEKRTIKIAEKMWDVYPSNAINEMDIDIVVISSYTHRKRIREELEKSEAQFEIIDIYDALKKGGVDVNAPFYRNAEDTYENVIHYRKAYMTDNNSRNLKNLIVAYLKICDFINFKKYAKEYITNAYEDYQHIEKAFDEIQLFMQSVKKQLRSRTQRDIIVVWNDQVGYCDLKHAVYMSKISENSMFFENAFTMTPFTMPVFYEMFQRLKSIDDGIYHRERSVTNAQNSEVIRDLEMAGYEFVYIGDESSAMVFEADCTIPSYVYNSSCVRCVDLLQKLLDEKRPVCAILHALTETHNPYLSGELDSAMWYEWPRFEGGTEEIALEQMKKSLAYWDKQLEYYMGFMPEACVKLFMSDHGKRYNYQPIYKEPTTHILFFITGNDVPEKRCKKMFSLYDFCKVIRCIIKNDYQEDDIFNEYVLMQETNMFHNTTIQYYIENDVEEHSHAWRAVRTEKELYVKISSGKEYYYLLPDEETNCIGQADEKRIQQMEELAGDKFEDATAYTDRLAFFRKQFETHE